MFTINVHTGNWSTIKRALLNYCRSTKIQLTTTKSYVPQHNKQKKEA